MYGILESYIMRRVVVHASTKSYNNLFTSLILNKVLDSQTLTLCLKGIGDATTYCPDDNYFYMRADFVHYMIYLSSWKVHALR